MRQEAERLELGELRAHGRRGCTQARAFDERLRPHGLARGDELLDDEAEDLLLTRGEQRSTGR